MIGVSLEDFALRSDPRRPVPAAIVPELPDTGYEDGYNAGWDDAMAQVDAEQGQVGERLAERLSALERDQQDALRSAIGALEPLLYEIFDKLLPRAAERGFLGLLLEEASDLLSQGAGQLSIRVAPEEAPRLARLMERASLSPDRVAVQPEPALALSQALVRWDGGERRVDLQAVLDALDDSLESFLSTFSPEPLDD